MSTMERVATPVKITPDVLAWLNDDEGNSVEFYPGPGWDDADRYEPTPEEDAERLGQELGLAGEDGPDLCDLSVPTGLYLAMARGYSHGHGRRAYHEELERLAEIDRDHEAIMSRDQRFEEWVAELERVYGDGDGMVRDSDVWPRGCMS